MRREALGKAARYVTAPKIPTTIKILAQLGTADQQSLDRGLDDCLRLLDAQVCLGSRDNCGSLRKTSARRESRQRRRSQV